ncbi:MAG: hydroxymethylbilane synthase [Nitrospirae bacterium]|nr:MAG: hydroxymethylbilane synthase [Nitrospirota bacterium]
MPQYSRSSLVIGTRGSRLALWQAEWVQRQLQAAAPHLSIRLQRIRTSGDKILDVPLAKIGGKGLFVKEIEEALLQGEIDLAVHSMKDVPVELPKGLTLVCIPKREAPFDAFLSLTASSLSGLPQGATVGTSSLRRQAQLLAYRADLSIRMLRGNVETRLRKLREGQYDAIVLAAAGLRRLGLDQQVREYLSPAVSLPAIGQGALGIEAREDHETVRALVMHLDDWPTRIAVTAERAFLRRLGGGCQVPIAGYAVVEGQTVTLEGLVASIDGRQMVRERLVGHVDEAQRLGTRLADRVLEAGGRAILEAIYRQT